METSIYTTLYTIQFIKDYLTMSTYVIVYIYIICTIEQNVQVLSQKDGKQAGIQAGKPILFVIHYLYRSDKNK